MDKAKIQSGNGRSGRVATAVRTRVASFLTCLYLFLSIFAPLHSHTVGGGYSKAASAACASHGVLPRDAATGEETAAIADRDASTQPAIAAPDCPICDFLAQPVTVETAPSVVSVPIAQTAIPAPPVRAAAFKPFRFCDRSAARAPPAISSLHA